MRGPVAGRFTQLEPVSRGGMGSVFRAVDGRSGDRVALKILYGAGASDADRLGREADALAAVSHPAIVRYIDHGRTDRGELYLAMEWLEGETLADRLQRGALDVGEAVRLGSRLAGALAAAHARGVVHRDLKPNNVMLVERSLERPMLVDFGLAKVDRARVITQPGSVMGTPAYMAPEQARGAREVDARADVFALGCVTYECLCGNPPFRGDDPWAVLAKVLFEEPLPAAELRAGVPAALDELLAGMLAKAPGDRPDAESLVARLLATVEDAGMVRDATGPARLTGAEKRLVSLIVAEVTPGERHGLPTAETLAVTPTDGGSGSVEDMLDRMRAVAQPFGAHVEQLAAGHLVAVLQGDGVAPDLAGQAARCALALRARLGDSPIVLATGAAMVVGRMPVGEIIDRAARLLSAGTEPDAAGRMPVVIDEVTAGLLAPSFVAGQRGARLELWSERRGAPPVRTLLGRPAPFVGRDRELLTIEASLAEAVSESVPRAVLVTGPAGAGKSRLRHELLTRAARRGLPAAWIGRADPVGAGSPFGLIADALRGALEISEGGPLEQLRARMRERVDPAICDFLGEIVGVPFPDEVDTPLHAARRDALLMGDRMRGAFESYLRRRTADAPVVIVLEDLHWGDLPSVRLVETALRNLSSQPLFVLALARPDVHERFPALWQEVGCVHVPLPELSRRAGERLVRSVLPDATDDAVGKILDRAVGNAFLLEELTRATAEGWTELPATVRAVAQARLDGLDVDARRVLRAASVFGGTFWSGGVAHLLGDDTIAGTVRSRLERLIEREVLTRRESSRIAGERELVFRHVLLREAAYESLGDADRRLGHRLAGEWLEARGERDAMLLAGHFDHAGLAEHAAQFFQQAATEALAGNDYQAAIERAARGAALTEDPLRRGRLRLVEAEAHRWRGDTAAAEEAGAAAMADSPRGSETWIDAAARRGEVATLNRRFDLADEMAQQLIDARPEAEARESWVIGCAKLASRLLIDERHEWGERLLVAIAGLDLSTIAGISLAWMARAQAFVRARRGDHGGAATWMAASAGEFQRAGDLRNEIVQRLNQVELLLDVGAIDDATALLAEVLPRIGSMSDVLSQHATAVRAQLAARGDRPEDALAILLPWLDRGGYPRVPGLALCDLAEAHRRLGNLDEAATLIEAAAERLRAYPPMSGAVAAVASTILLDRGRADEALIASRSAAPYPWAISGRIPQLRLAAIRALEALGRIDEAREDAAAALASLQERADFIDDPAARARFYDRVLHHRDIVAAAQRLGC